LDQGAQGDKFGAERDQCTYTYTYTYTYIYTNTSINSCTCSDANSNSCTRLQSSEVVVVNEKTTTVHLFLFEFRKLRISGRQWMAHKFAAADDDVVEDSILTQQEQAEAATKVQSLLTELTDTKFLLAKSEDQLITLQKMFAGDRVKERLDVTMVDVLDRKRILRTESRLLHQKRLSLDFVRKIDSLCAGYGDPIVIVFY
jgi:hypothetical protein